MRGILQSSFLGLVLLVAGGAVAASEFEQAMSDYCQKMRGCAEAQMGDVPPDMRPMINAMLDNMCVEMQQNLALQPQMRQDHPLLDSASACLRSLQALSCAQMEGAGTDTPACQRHEKLASEWNGG